MKSGAGWGLRVVLRWFRSMPAAWRCMLGPGVPSVVTG
jgi:hypothetical protein